MPDLNLDTRPVLWGVSTYQLADCFRQIVPAITDRVKLEIISGLADDAVARIKERLQHEHCDVLVSAGANAAYLNGRLPLPVVTVRIGGFDIMDALVKARRLSDKIGIVLHTTTPGDMREFLAKYSLPIELRFYDTMQDAHNVVTEFLAMGIRAVVGGGLVVHVAEEAGMAGIFIYTLDSIRLAIEDALNLVKAKQIERSRFSLLNTVLHHLGDGVLAVDMEDRLITANPAAEKLTRCELKNVLGKPLHVVLPALNFKNSTDNGTPQTGVVEDIAGHAIVVDRSPLFEASTRIGTVVTLHSPSYVERAFSKLRIHSHTRSRVARYTLADVVAESPLMETAVKRCTVFAEHSDATVLLYGPSGVGKELLAQGIHNAGVRRSHPFIAVNCGAFPESLLESELFGYEEGAFTGARRNGKPGLFEAADKGTIFFDEIAELPLLLQTRLLRVLQEREIIRLGGQDTIPVDVRIISATHRDLFQLVKEGAFRQDLFYRISVLRVTIPPLRDRPEDLEVLSRRLFGAAFERIGLANMLPRVLSVAESVLSAHSWPGNVRELENVAERIAMACLETRRPVSAKQVEVLMDTPDVSDADYDDGAELSHKRRAQEMAYIREVLKQCGGNRGKAAQRLGVTRTTLWRKLNTAERNRDG
jgi:propionate catabolism operon transcriptional regulator